MKTFSRLTTSMLAGAALSVTAFSAYADTETGDAQVTIVEPLVLTAADTLDFGIVSKPVTGSVTRIITPAGAIDGASTATTGSATNDNPAAGSFTVTGTDGLTVTVDIANIQNVPTGVTVDQFDIVNGANSLSDVDTSQGTMAIDTASSITVGATMTIADTVTAGTYNTISYDLTVDYQ